MDTQKKLYARIIPLVSDNILELISPEEIEQREIWGRILNGGDVSEQHRHHLR